MKRFYRNLYRNAGAELPLTLLAVAFFLMLVFQTVELVRQSQTLAAIIANQTTPIQETQRLRQATDALAGDVAQLAKGGNAHARQIVDAMARQNITLNPPSPQPEPAPPAQAEPPPPAK